MWNVLLTFVCMGTKWMVEYVGAGYAQWWTGSEWTTDPHTSLHFDTSDETVSYIVDNIWEVPVDATEHMFMSPVSTEEKLN